MSFSRYSEYKDSGVEWLGQVPAHWRALRLRWLCGEPICNGVGEASDQDDPANPRYIRITDIADSRHLCDDSFRSLPPEIAERAPVKVGDILLAAVGATYGKSYLHSQDIGPACFAGYLVKFTPANKICSAYIAYWTESAQYWAQVNSRVIQSTVQNFSASRFRELTAPVPPYSEQVLIAEFLDREVERIDGLVAQQERLIALLKEKRQAVISHAVTKGLDPNVPMKDSGIEWLGSVPAHWKIAATRRLIVRIEQGWSPECYSRPAEGGEWGVLKAGCVNGGVLNEHENKALPEELEPHPEYEVREGDLLMSRASGSPELVGSTAFVKSVKPLLMLSDKIFRIHVEDFVIPEYFAWLFNSKVMRTQIARSISGADGLANNLPQSSLLAFLALIPPPYEQFRIIAHINEQVDTIDKLAGEAEKSIELLQERRHSIISAAVTGKIKILV